MFVKGSAAMAVMMGAGAMLAGCGGSSSSTSASASASASASGSAASASASSASAAAITPNAEMEELNTVLLGKDAKIACIIVAMQRSYYD